MVDQDRLLFHFATLSLLVGAPLLALQYLSQHEADRVPRDAPLRVEVVEVIHDELRRRGKVRLVELVRDVPS